MEMDRGVKCCGLSLCAVPFYMSMPLYFRGAEQRDKADEVHPEAEM